MADVSCANCGATEDLVEHHTSYLPERTEVLCKECDAKERRHVKSKGLILTLKAYPQRGTVYIPINFLKQFGELPNLYTAPISPVGILYPDKMTLEEVEKATQIILQDVRLRMGKVGEELKVE